LILAEDDDEEEGTAGQRGGVLSLPVSMHVAQSPEQRYQPPQEETWVPFDPENEDEDDDEDNPHGSQAHGSQVSDVELARAAGDSFLSGDEVGSV
jgi:hypothetical protein